MDEVDETEASGSMMEIKKVIS